MLISDTADYASFSSDWPNVLRIVGRMTIQCSIARKVSWNNVPQDYTRNLLSQNHAVIASKSPRRMSPEHS